MRKSLHSPEDLAEVHQRISQITENTQRKWGRMNSAQMMRHCAIILRVSTGQTVLPKTGLFLKTIGICAKLEIKLFNNGIPPNMPTYEAVKLKENCNFEEAMADLFDALNDFNACARAKTLRPTHELFGKLSHSDWGFLQYKHINHHLKQFGK